MGSTIDLKASDGHRLNAYLAEPNGKPRGGIVVIQEIFGVTRHIRAVADQYAAAGFLAIAPALFDRIQPGIDVPYTDIQTGFAHMQKLQSEQVMLDVRAAVDRVAAAGKVGVVGFCWGGTMTYLAAARLPIAAAISYYGGGTSQYLAEKPRCPILFHYGELDAHIPMSQVDEVRAANPGATFHLYKAEHGFNCTDRSSFEPASAKLALERSLEFFHRHVG
ncbi:MAG: dienelactone hydrolase family protein [Gammaproteobacteria bacterium]|nr:dienelactone hydrolase family protein [Gammaproteobacteria bacterium]